MTVSKRKYRSDIALEAYYYLRGYCTPEKCCDCIFDNGDGSCLFGGVGCLSYWPLCILDRSNEE